MKKPIFSLFLVALAGVIFFSFPNARAADHGDGPAASNDPSADLGDVFFFLDPNDNNRVVLSLTTRGFIVPGEAVNMGIFDPKVVYRFMLEETGDVIPDVRIDVTFGPRMSNSAAQVATIRMDRGAANVFQFTAPATNPNLSSAPPAQVVTTDPASGASFFAGEVDDPFFFDIPAFSRFVAAVLAGTPNPGAAFTRARDSFAGYNTMAISLSLPKALLQNANGVVGLEGLTLRADPQFGRTLGNLSTRGPVEGGARVLIGGLIVSGTGPKQLIIRGLGPSLAANNVPGPLPNPTLKLFNSQAQLVASNDNWQDTQAAQIAATQLAPTNPQESAILATLPPGGYTVILDDAAGATGIGVVEIYDLDVATPTVLHTVDRAGVPGVNVALVPFARKDEYNTGTPEEDANGRFAASIVATLRALGTDDTNIGILAEVAVLHGDYLRLNFNTPNSGGGGGNNSGAGFPNGRRLGDDVIDTLLFFILNQRPLPDNVNANDVPLRDAFPFFAFAQQPRDSGVDDNTRN